jgi:hypothetical protein
MTRKTVDVTDVIHDANKRMYRSLEAFANYQHVGTDWDYDDYSIPEATALENRTDEYRKGIVNMLERILHDTGNYNGFQFATDKGTDIESELYYARFYYGGEYSPFTWRKKVKANLLIDYFDDWDEKESEELKDEIERCKEMTQGMIE